MKCVCRHHLWQLVSKATVLGRGRKWGRQWRILCSMRSNKRSHINKRSQREHCHWISEWMNEWMDKCESTKKKKKGWQQDQAFLKFSSESPGLWRNIEKMSSPYVLPFWAAWAGEYHINANFCYNHLFTLNYVLKELESPNAGYYIRGCQENVSLSPKWFIVSDEQPPPLLSPPDLTSH